MTVMPKRFHYCLHLNVVNQDRRSDYRTVRRINGSLHYRTQVLYLIWLLEARSPHVRPHNYDKLGCGVLPCDADSEL